MLDAAGFAWNVCPDSCIAKQQRRIRGSLFLCKDLELEATIYIGMYITTMGIAALEMFAEWDDRSINMLFCSGPFFSYKVKESIMFHRGAYCHSWEEHRNNPRINCKKTICKGFNEILVVIESDVKQTQLISNRPLLIFWKKLYNNTSLLHEPQSMCTRKER